MQAGSKADDGPLLRFSFSLLFQGGGGQTTFALGFTFIRLQILFTHRFLARADAEQEEKDGDDKRVKACLGFWMKFWCPCDALTLCVCVPQYTVSKIELKARKLFRLVYNWRQRHLWGKIWNEALSTIRYLRKTCRGTYSPMLNTVLPKKHTYVHMSENSLIAIHDTPLSTFGKVMNKHQGKSCE